MVNFMSSIGRLLLSFMLIGSFLLTSSCTIPKNTRTNSKNVESSYTINATKDECKDNIDVKYTEVDYSVLTSEDLRSSLYSFPLTDKKNRNIELLSAAGDVLLELDMFKNLPESKFFQHNGNLLEIRTCYLNPIRLIPFVPGNVVSKRINRHFRQPNLPKELKAFMQENFGYKDSLPNSLAYVSYGKEVLSDKHSYAIAFIPLAYSIKYKKETYYVLKSINLEYSCGKLEEKRLLNLPDVVDPPNGILCDNYCDGVYARISYTKNSELNK